MVAAIDGGESDQDCFNQQARPNHFLSGTAASSGKVAVKAVAT